MGSAELLGVLDLVDVFSPLEGVEAGVGMAVGDMFGRWKLVTGVEPYVSFANGGAVLYMLERQFAENGIPALDRI